MGSFSYMTHILCIHWHDVVIKHNDTNTLYSGSRNNSLDHLLTALKHSFDYMVTEAPIIADGLRSEIPAIKNQYTVAP